MKKYSYKVLRFDLKLKYGKDQDKDGATRLEARLNKHAKEGFRVVQIVEEHEGLVSRKALILEKLE